MGEGNISEKIYSNSPAGQAVGLEGAIATGRELGDCQFLLGIKAEALNRKSVLHFGSGSSNLDRDLQKLGMESRVVDVDIKFDPYTGNFRLLSEIARPINFVANLLPRSTRARDRLIRLKRRMAGVADRKFAQADGRKLPFADQHFDFVLAPWSTYQIPDESKETVYRELMRVGNTLHVGPIYGKDFKLLTKLATELNFDLVACQPLTKGFSPQINFMFDTPQSYDDYMKQPETRRVHAPQIEDVNVTTFLGWKAVGMGGGSSIVLKRKQTNKR